MPKDMRGDQNNAREKEAGATDRLTDYDRKASKRDEQGSRDTEVKRQRPQRKESKPE